MNEKIQVSKLSPDLVEKIVDNIVELAEFLGEMRFYPYQKPFARRLTQSIVTNEGATLTALFSRQCIAENSLIMDREGKILPINKHPAAWKTNDSAEIYEIKARGGHVIYCTEEHPIATSNGWVTAQALKKFDQIVVLDKWDKFGSGVIPSKNFTMNNDLAELVGWFTAVIKSTDEVRFITGKDRVLELLGKYFPDTKMRLTRNQANITIEGTLKSFLKIMKYNSFGFPENVNYFTREQLIHFFYPIFLLRGQSYKKVVTIKTTLRGNKRFLEYCKEHLNKLGMHGNYEVWTGEVLIFQGITNFTRLKELFGNLPKEFFPPFYIVSPKRKEIFTGADGEELTYSPIHSIKKLDKQFPVWDITIEDKGWFLCSGVKVSNSGKSTIVAMITAACMIILPQLAEKFPDNFGVFSKGFWAGCFGPIGEQAVTMFEKIYDVFTTDNTKRLLIEEMHMPIPAKGGARGNLIRLKNKSLCRYQSASRRAKVESKTYHLIILDECQDIDQFKISKSINPSGAATNATVVATGTPDVYVGYFYDTIEQNKVIDLKGNSPKKFHFEVDYTIAQKYNPMYKKYIAKEKKRLGENSDSFMMAYRLIWPITKGMVFTKAQLEEKCYDKSLKFVQEYKDTPCIAGLDLGKAQNSTVVFVIRPFWEEADEEGNMPKQVLNYMELEGDDWEEQYPKVIDFLSHYSVDTLICDTTGVGDPVRERYSVLLPNVNVLPFMFSPTSKDIMYKYFIQEVNNDRLKIPAHTTARSTNRFKKFEHQMTTLKKHYSGKFLSPCPVDPDKGHDDYPDACGLAVFGTFYEIIPEIEEYSNDFFRSSRSNEEQHFGRDYARVRK